MTEEQISEKIKEIQKEQATLAQILADSTKEQTKIIQEKLVANNHKLKELYDKQGGL